MKLWHAIAALLVTMALVFLGISTLVDYLFPTKGAPVYRCQP